MSHELIREEVGFQHQTVEDGVPEPLIETFGFFDRDVHVLHQVLLGVNGGMVELTAGHSKEFVVSASTTESAGVQRFVTEIVIEELSEHRTIDGYTGHFLTVCPSSLVNFDSAQVNFQFSLTLR